MSPPTVLIAANPYEGERCRRALADTGLRVELVEGGEGAAEALAGGRPLMMVIAAGLYHVDALELLGAARAAHPTMPIFFISDPEGELAAQGAAARAGVQRLFLRPVEPEQLADAIEKLAVEVELAGEVSDQLESVAAERAASQVASDLLPALVPLAGTGEGIIRPVRTEVLEGETPVDGAGSSTPAESEAASLSAAAPSLRADSPEARTEPPLLRAELSLLAAGAPRAEPFLLRADEALSDGPSLLEALAGDGFAESSAEPAGGVLPSVRTMTQSFDERSTFARRLDDELSAAERRLFPDAAPTPGLGFGDYDDALGDIDLDALGIDTLPGLTAEGLDALFRRREAERRERGSIGTAPGATTAPGSPPASSAPSGVHGPLEQLSTDREAILGPLEEQGSLDLLDVAALIGRLYAAGWTGRLTLLRGDGEKTLYFDSGHPVFAHSSFTHERLAGLLYREGKLSSEQYLRARDLQLEPGRRAASRLVEMGLLKSSEVFSTLRRQLEEIFCASFSWDAGEFRLDSGAVAAEDRVRLTMHPWALILEGIRRKYGLERLMALVGPAETILAPTAHLPRALQDCALTAAERAAAELLDGERSVGEIARIAGELGGESFDEAGLYALLWGLSVVGALQEGLAPALLDEPTAPGGELRPVRSERRALPRGQNGERSADRSVDRERLLAKRIQVTDGDYFAILGVDRDASAYEIQRAFQRQRADFQPERFSEAVRVELADALAEIAEVLVEAHLVLSDEEVRASYREHLLS